MRHPEPFTDPKKCSIQELEEILRDDPEASFKYKEELDRKIKQKQEIEYWEEHYESS